MRASTSDSWMVMPAFLAPSSTSWNWIRPSRACRVAPSMSWDGCWPCCCWACCWPSWALVISVVAALLKEKQLTVAASWLRTPRPEQPAARTATQRTGSRRRTDDLTFTTRRQCTSIPAGAALRVRECRDELPTGPEPLRHHAVPPGRAQRARAARHLARAVAELRRRPAAGDPAGDRAPRLRPRHHPLRPGQQLRPALRLGRGELRPHPRHRPARPP